MLGGASRDGATPNYEAIDREPPYYRSVYKTVGVRDPCRADSLCPTPYC